MPLVPIRRNLYAWEAEAFASRLRAEGIACTVAADHARLAWAHTLALGGATVLVDAADQALALELLAEPAGDAELPEFGDACPRCGSGQVEMRRPGALWLLMSLLLTAPFPARAGRRRCSACGHAWRARLPGWMPEPDSARLRAAEQSIGVGAPRRGELPWFAIYGLVLLTALALALVRWVTLPRHPDGP